jgi:hypothetical protein
MLRSFLPKAVTEIEELDALAIHDSLEPRFLELSLTVGFPCRIPQAFSVDPSATLRVEHPNEAVDRSLRREEIIHFFPPNLNGTDLVPDPLGASCVG